PSTSRTGPCPPNLARRTEPRTSLSPKSHESRAVRHCRSAGPPKHPNIRQSDPKPPPAPQIIRDPVESISFKIAKSVQGQLKNSKCDSPAEDGGRTAEEKREHRHSGAV